MQLKILLINLFIFSSMVYAEGFLENQASLKVPSTVNEKDFKKLITELDKLAQYKAAASNYTLGALYLVGDKKNNIKQDFKKAYNYFLKDTDNLTLASYKIAEMHYYRLLKKPEEKNCDCVENAIKWYKIALEKKDTIDYLHLFPFVNAAIGTIYLNDLKDGEKAFPYLLKAVKSSNKFPKLEFVVGYLYNNPKMSYFNEEKANKWLNKSWNNPSNTPEFRKVILNYVEGQ